MSRIGVVDIGTNSTRLLVADVTDGRVRELERRTEVTRLGEGVDASGRLGEGGIARVRAALDLYDQLMDDHRVERRIGVLTSAVRDADNGPQFTESVRSDFGIDARTIPGEEEAQLTFLGATSERDPDDQTPLVVIDIGGGSTELVLGHGRKVYFHVSTQAGVVRQTERHLADDDPPLVADRQRLADEVEEIVRAAVPAEVFDRPAAAIAVAGTATSLAAIDQALEPYDPAKVHGHVVSLDRAQRIGDALGAISLAERRGVAGLHPDRAPTIVAGITILTVVLELFGLDEVEVSEHDILHGVALSAVGR